jgi:uncharacterized membrane protein
MKSIVRMFLAVLAVTLVASHASFAKADVSVPEVDPATAVGVLALISGGIMVIRGRGKKKD